MIEEEKKKMPGISENKNISPLLLISYLQTNFLANQLFCYVYLRLSLDLTFCYPFSAYMKTSLKKPIGIFVQFLKGLESENDNRRKSFRDAEGKWMERMFAELLHNTEKKNL